MKYAVSLVTAALLLSLGTAALADTTALTPFGPQYRERLPDRCADARTAAYTIARAGDNVAAAQAHRGTRAFVDCANALRSYVGVDEYLLLLAGSSELLAAQHETGTAAAASEQNAVAFLTPIVTRGSLVTSLSYHDAPAAFGAGAIVPVIELGRRVIPDDPSGLETIANILIHDAQGVPQ